MWAPFRWHAMHAYLFSTISKIRSVHERRRTVLSGFQSALFSTAPLHSGVSYQGTRLTCSAINNRFTSVSASSRNTGFNTHTKKMLPKKYILPPFGKKNEITDFSTRRIIGFMCRQSPNNGGQVGTELMILLSCLLFKWFYYLDIIKWELGRSISQFCCHRAYINRDRDLQIMIFNLCRARTVCYFLLMAGAVRVVRVKCKHLVMETFHSHARISTARVCR